MKNIKINVSFANTDRDYKVFEYLQTKRDKSNFIKDLVESQMKLEQSLISTVQSTRPR